jgi:Zn-dependent M28 family amino/carboxypeptidase
MKIKTDYHFMNQSKITNTLLFLLIFTTAFAQKKELQSITEHELKAHLEFIAGDNMQGRDFGTPNPGLQITADYLKAQCLEMGLKPGITNFSQTVKMVSIQIEKEKTFIKLKNSGGEVTFKSNDIQTFPGSLKSDTIEAKIVFAGYGYQNDDIGYNDFEGLDLSDKMVLVMTRNRELAIDTANGDDNSRMEMLKLGRIFLSGAKGVIFVPDPLNPDNSWFEMVKDYASQGKYQLDESDQFEMPGNIIVANIEIANAILKESGKTLEEIQIEINKSGKPNSFELEKVTAEIQLVKKAETVTGENIIAIIEGSDPVLKNECVVLTAHYDHVGINSKGEINNGADDNGSGTVALLEVAEAFSKMKKKPLRSIVFAWVTAEEKGLIGSEYYTQNPVFPLKNTLANINLDMVGRSAEKELAKVENSEKSLAGPNGIYIISGDQSSELTSISNKICSDLKLVPSDALSEEFMYGSDHFNFNKNGVPVLGVTTGLHEDYHTPADDFEKIDYLKMKRIADYTFLVTYEIANRKKRILVDNPDGK